MEKKPPKSKVNSYHINFFEKKLKKLVCFFFNTKKEVK